MSTAKITSKGQITLPKEVRKRLGVGPGDEVEFAEENGRYVLTKKVRKSPFGEYRGFLSGLKGWDPDQVIQELRGK